MFKFTKQEIKELVKAWTIISLAFTILFYNPLQTGFRLDKIPAILILFLFALLTAGLGFLVHELAHKYMAEKYGCKTMFVADNSTLTFAVIMSFFGLIFAAPGAVKIYGSINRKQNGKISVAGPVSNIILALIFLLIVFVVTSAGTIFIYGFAINSWLALFNMIPFGNFDGKKVWAWNKKMYFLVAIIALVMSIIAILI